MSKLIRNFCGFALLRSVIGSENSRHFLDQSDSKIKLITPWSRQFCCASGSLLVFTLDSLDCFVLIGHDDYFRFVLRHLIER